MSDIKIAIGKGKKSVKSIDVPKSGGLISVTPCTWYDGYFTITHVATGFAFPASFKSKTAAMCAAKRILKFYPSKNLSEKTNSGVMDGGKITWRSIAEKCGINGSRRKQ